MPEVVCDSKSFVIELLLPEEYLEPRVEILEHTLKAIEGQHVEVKFRVWNDGDVVFELEELTLEDSTGVVEKASWVGVITSPNIEPGEHYEKTLSTYGPSRDMPGHPWELFVKACVRPKGWL